MNFIINRKVLISMLFIAVSMLGVISYQYLEMEIFPSTELPELSVQINSYIEVTPEYMEQKAVIPVESAIASLENIEEIESTAGKKRGKITIYYEKGTDLKFAYLKLDEELIALRSQLPGEFTLQVLKSNFDFASNTLMNLEVRGGGGIDRIRNFTDQKIIPELESVDGVAGVGTYGGQQKSVEIRLNKIACEAYDISPSQVRSSLSRNMAKREYGGLVKETGKRFYVYLNADYENINQIKEIVIGRGENAVQLRSIAEVYFGTKEETTISRVNGKDAVMVTVINDAQANIIDLSHAVEDQIEKLNEKYKSSDVEINVQFNTAKTMEDNINQVINLALTGGALAVFILWVFLRNIRLVLVVALSMPISVYAAFNFFYAYDVTINSLTLVGLALAVGMLLDTSVVVLENIYRLRTAGHSAAKAAVKGTSEVWRSVVAATL
ncbi:MAG: efflux RND transporter permease subunit, partial [Bacteroidales bacterium]|nr:efflux RND transporter permease subunit [Bacteroidales bacterium]